MRSSLEPFLIASQSLLVLLHQTNRVAHSSRCQMATVRFSQLCSFLPGVMSYPSPKGY